MGKVCDKKRHIRLRIRAKKREKIQKLRQKYLQARTRDERQRILEKALRINPYLTPETFLEPISRLQEKAS